MAEAYDIFTRIVPIQNQNIENYFYLGNFNAWYTYFYKYSLAVYTHAIIKQEKIM